MPIRDELGGTLDRPQPSQVEVSIFGRGIGECIVMHIGDNQWVVIDSFLTRDRRPVALEYFDTIDVDPATSINQLIASHWHDDHVAGISEIYEKATDSHFCLASVLTSDEMAGLVKQAKRFRVSSFTSGVSELSKTVDIRTAQKRAPFKHLGAHTVSLRGLGSDFTHGKNIEIESLSPSDLDFQLFLDGLATYDEADRATSRVMPRERNHISVCVSVRIGDVQLLLGADVEVVSEANSGWLAILNSTARPTGRSEIFKISHHGSPNGDHTRIWEEMVSEDAIAVLTPYGRGVTQRPQNDDLLRVAAYGRDAFQAGINSHQSKRHAQLVEKILRRHAEIKIQRFDQRLGLVRLRKDFSDDHPEWECKCFGAAENIVDLIERP